VTAPEQDPRGRFSVAFGPDERVRVVVETDDGVLALTDRRVVGRDALQAMLDVPVTAVRRIQLDVEKHRPATVVVVPDDATKVVMALSVPADQLASVSELVVRVGAELEAADGP
jgi:hypothetical protein